MPQKKKKKKKKNLVWGVRIAGLFVYKYSGSDKMMPILLDPDPQHCRVPIERRQIRNF
jgi:hypothetical protein